VSAALKPYLARSAGLHAAALAAFLLIAPRASVKPSSVYMIDFVGPSATIVSAGPAAAAPAAEAKAPAKPGAVPAQVDPDSIGRRAGPAALPRPSLLGGAHDDNRAPALPAPGTSLAGQAPKGAAAAAAAAAASAGPAGAGVATDLPNFPYPWYISQVRLMLWQSWQSRMPALDADGVVAFSILPDGSFTDLSMESSSGDADFDRAALASVQSAAPFPPLPRGFREPFLKIHLTLKSEASWR
jgi:protein TonB